MLTNAVMVTANLLLRSGLHLAPVPAPVLGSGLFTHYLFGVRRIGQEITTRQASVERRAKRQRTAAALAEGSAGPTNRSDTMTFEPRWQPFQNLGDEKARRPQDDMDLMHNMLARARRRDGTRQPAGYDGRRVSLDARPRRLRA